jgi:hypothetical protein
VEWLEPRAIHQRKPGAYLSLGKRTYWLKVLSDRRRETV